MSSPERECMHCQPVLQVLKAFHVDLRQLELPGLAQVPRRIMQISVRTWRTASQAARAGRVDRAGAIASSPAASRGEHQVVHGRRKALSPVRIHSRRPPWNVRMPLAMREDVCPVEDISAAEMRPLDVTHHRRALHPALPAQQCLRVHDLRGGRLACYGAQQCLRLHNGVASSGLLP
jgi:hypothetical protein